MAELIKTFRVKLPGQRKEHRLRLCFDTGSPWTFVKESVARRLLGRADWEGPNLMELGEPRSFGGLGNGRFVSRYQIAVETWMVLKWGPYAMCVVPDEDLGESWDILIGHDFMQKYGVSCFPRKSKVAFDRTTLLLSDFVR